MTETGKKRGRRATKKTEGLFRRKFTRKDGSVYEGDIWYMRYTAPDGDKPGKMRQVIESTGTDNKTDAGEVLTKRKAAVLEQRHPELRKNDPLFSEYVKDVYLPAHIKQSSYREKRKYGNMFAKRFEFLKLSQITAEMLTAYRKQKTDSGVTDATVNRHFAFIKHVYSFASKSENKSKVSMAKLAEIQSCSLGAEPDGRVFYFTKEQVQQIYDACVGEYEFLKPIFQFALNTGLRKGRVLHLTWDMVNFLNSKMAFINLPKDKWGGAFRASLHPKAVAVLQEMREKRHPDSPYVFYDPKTLKAYYDMRVDTKIIKSATDAVGVRGFHDFRHTFISWLAMSDVPLATISRLAGHKTLAMTMRYMHLSPKYQIEALQKLDYDVDPFPDIPLEPELKPEPPPKATKKDTKKDKPKK